MSSRKPYAKHSISQTKEGELAKAFRLADKDNDGCLTQAEYIKVFRDQGVPISEDAALSFFRDKDKDMDGKISYEEFVGKMTMTEKLWQAMDVKDKGLVKLEDAERVVKKYKKTLPDSMSGQLLQEFSSYLQKKASMAPPAPPSSSQALEYAEFCQVMHKLSLTSPSDDSGRTKRPGKPRSLGATATAVSAASSMARGGKRELRKGTSVEKRNVK